MPEPEQQFKTGSLYTRDDVWKIYHPNLGERPQGGNWDTGYTKAHEDSLDLVVFCNIGIPGRTGHDYQNYYDAENKTIVWFGKNNTHSQQPLMKALIDKKLTSHFFVRTDVRAKFKYLGIGKIVNWKEPNGTNTSIQFTLTFEDLNEIVDEGSEEHASTFQMEKHLEHFLVENWSSTELGKNYDIYEIDGVPMALDNQLRTDTGPMDILAIKKDKSSLLVIELKKGRAGDKAVAQTLRYMNYVRERIKEEKQGVKGCIIALEDDIKIRRAISEVPDIKFYKYEVKFRLIQN